MSHLTVREKLGDTENDLKPNLQRNFWSVGVSVVWFGFGEFRSPREKRQTLRDRPIKDFSYIWPPGPYNMLTWSSLSVCPLDYFDSDRTDMRRRNLSEDHDGGSDPEREIRNRRQKLSKDLDGDSDSNRTLRHRPIHGHNQVRGQDIREGKIRNREYQGFSNLEKISSHDSEVVWLYQIPTSESGSVSKRPKLTKTKPNNRNTDQQVQST